MYKQIKTRELKIGDVFAKSISLRERKSYHVISVDYMNLTAIVKENGGLHDSVIKINDHNNIYLLKRKSE